MMAATKGRSGTLGFDDSTSSQGPAELGYGEGDEVTPTTTGPNPASPSVTTYFRHEFDIADAAAVTDLTIGVLRDDGFAAYLNGVEVGRNNLSSHASYLTKAFGPREDNNRFVEFDLDPRSPSPVGMYWRSNSIRRRRSWTTRNLDVRLIARVGGDTVPTGILLNDFDSDGNQLFAVTSPSELDNVVDHGDLKACQQRFIYLHA